MTEFTVLNVQGTYPEAIPVYRPDFPKWRLVDEKDDGKGSREAVYQYMAGDPTYPANIRVGVYEKADTVNISVKGTTYIKKDVGGLGEAADITYHPLTATVAISGPKGGVPGVIFNEGELIDVDKWIQNVAIFAGMGFAPLATAALDASPDDLMTGFRAQLAFGLPGLGTINEAEGPATA